MTAFAPRTGSQTKGYADETSDYYWAVLPASLETGHGVSTDPVLANPQSFVKQATPPSLLGPTSGVVVSSAATMFHWTPVFAARRYRLQVSDDPTFANVIQEQSAVTPGALTDSSAYTSSTAYPTGKTLYWRVQAEAENGSSGFVGLRWSTTGTFQRAAGAGGGTADLRFKVSAKGYPVRRVYRTVTLTVRNLATNAPVASANAGPCKRRQSVATSASEAAAAPATARFTATPRSLPATPACGGRAARWRRARQNGARAGRAGPCAR